MTPKKLLEALLAGSPRGAKSWGVVTVGIGLSSCLGQRQLAPPPTSTKSPISNAHAGASEKDSPGPWPGPRGAYAFAEGESFEVMGQGWSVVERAPGKRDRSQASAGRVLDGGGAGHGSARKQLAISHSGAYSLWLRASRLQGYRAAALSKIGLKVTSGSRVVAEAVLDPAGPDVLPTPGVREEDYGWLKLPLILDAGSVTVSFSKVGQDRVAAGARAIDAVLLTEDPAYRPDYRDFNPQLYVRMSVNHASVPAVRFGNAVTSSRQARGWIAPPVPPGSSTAWINATRWFSGADFALWSATAEPASASVDYVVDFASGPDASHLIRRIAVPAAGRVTFVVPPLPSSTSLPMADFELAQERARRVESWPVPSFGKRPQRFPVLANLRTNPLAEAGEKRVLAHAGLNGFTGLLTDDDIAKGFVHSRLYNSAYYLQPAGTMAPDLAKIDKDLRRHATLVAQSGQADRVSHLNLIDEAQAMSLEQLASHVENQAGFRNWLAERGYQPFSSAERQQLVAAGKRPENQIALSTSRDGKYPGLYYYSQRFRAYLVAHAFAQITRKVHELYPPGVKSTQNLSDGPVVFANMYHQGNDYFEYFKTGALDVALSEDWTNAGATRQLSGYNVALLRAATKYRGQPIHMYDVAYSSRRPVEVKLKALSEIAQGAKLLLIYDYLPKYQASGGGGGWAEQPLVIAAVAELTREIGAAEDVLTSAMPVPADTALLYSIPQDIWSAGFDQAQGNERLFTYLALRHAHVAVDVISDDDAMAGWLLKYRTLYVQGEQLDQRLIPVLLQWVELGGSLILSPGAGSRDEWNRPSDALERGLGLRRQPLQVIERGVGASGNLAKWKGQASSVELTGGGGALALFVEQRFESGPDQQILARFSDGAPAAVSFAHGHGRVTAFGFLPGTDYVRKAISSYRASPTPAAWPEYVAAVSRVSSSAASPPSRTDVYGVAPTEFDPRLCALITAEAQRRAVPRVEVDQPLVEATLLEGPEGWVVPLANYGRPTTRLWLRVRPSRPCLRAASAHHGPLPLEQQADGALVFELPLETTDFVFAACH